MHLKRFICIVILLIGFHTTQAQIFENKIFDNDIKTVLLYPSSNEIGSPVLQLNSNEQLVFSFDDLSEDSKTYYYKIIHCEQDWTPTQQESYEYIDGFEKATIDDYNYSYNTNTKYVNYKLQIPNIDMNITQSGNYALVVYEDTPSEPIITKRFIVKEDLVSINPSMILPKTKINYKEYQEILFNIYAKGMNIYNPYQEIQATVIQNQRWDNAYIGVAPRFIRNGSIDFDYNGKFVFEAGREFRRFDIRSIRFLGQGTRSIQDSDVYLLFDPIRRNERYFIESDLNGQYYIDVLEYRNRSVEADYVNVHFNMPLQQKFSNGKLYVAGQFNNYDIAPENEMQWNSQTSMYENSIFLKQGFYDYTYYFVRDDNNEKTFSITEGNDYEAENQYEILIYYKAFGERYSRVIGYINFNSKN
ncbi:MAG: DUF5103 domain-containing protein [Chitinophagales bacterium]|nr:DUF5103 domain-containing protein [Chitinophagales bacterium]